MPATTTSIRSMGRRYANGEDRPLGGFLALMGAYGSVVAGAFTYVRARDIDVPSRVDWRDFGLLSVATFRLSRLIAKDPVTSPLRAPFTRFEGQSGEAEVSEEVIGHGPQHAVGELLTCPFCLGQWVGTALFFGLIVAPRTTRWASSVLTAVAAADLMQFGYDALQS